MSDRIDTDVVIVGAGISGLATAQFLAERGIRVQVVEKEAQTGGTIASERVEGFLVEHGPNSTLDTTPLLHALFTAIGIEPSVEHANESAKNRYIVRRGRLISLPMNPLAFLKSPLFSASSKLRLLREPFIAPGRPDVDESLADFVRRRLGNEFLDYAINPFVAGVYAGDPEDLSVRSGFAKLYELEQRYGSLIKGAIKGAKERRKSHTVSKQSARLLSFTGGMETMITALNEHLRDSIRTRSLVRSVRRNGSGFEVDIDSHGGATTIASRAVLTAIPAYAYADFPLDFDFAVRERLVNIYYPPVSIVFFGFRDTPTTRPLDGFGFLIPKKENRDILGTIWNSSIFSNRAPDGGVALTSFVGGTRHPDKAHLDDNALVDVVRHDLRDLMGIERAPDVVKVMRWEQAIPQYRVGHHEIIEAIEEVERCVPGFFVSGNFRGGISVADCITQAQVMSGRVAESLAAGRAEPQEQCN